MHREQVRVLELVRIEEALPGGVRGGRGRPLADCAALARAFVAKAECNLPTARAVVERLGSDPALRRLCGWELGGAVPGDATFSRAFAEFAASDLPGQLRKALLERELEDRLAGHVARVSTAIPAREQSEPKRKQADPGAERAAGARRSRRRLRRKARRERRSDGSRRDVRRPRRERARSRPGRRPGSRAAWSCSRR